MALEWTTVDVPLVAGLDTGADERAVDPPSLLECENVRFTDRGGLRVRYPYVPLGAEVPAPVRAVASFNDELLAFTATNLYTWSPALTEWQDRGTYLAATVAHEPVFASPVEQVTADRAEVGGVALFTWMESDVAYVAAKDTTTGATLLAKTALAGSGTTRPRVVALSDRFHIFALDGTGVIYCTPVLPADIADGPSSWAASEVDVSNNDTNDMYDVAVADDDTFVTWQHTTTTSYGIASVAPDGTVNRDLIARTCDGVIAIAARGTSPNRNIMVVRVDGTNVEGDLLDESLADTAHINLAYGTVAADDDQITCAFRSVQDSSEYRCYAFWTGAESIDDTAFTLEYNYADTGGNVGSEATFLLRSGLASHAFDHNGEVYVWVTFAGTSEAAGMDEQLGLRAAVQNQYLLYRDDGTLVAKALGGSPDAGGGGLVQADGLLPGVQSLGSNRYAWAGLMRRIIPEGGVTLTPGSGAPDSIEVVDQGYAGRSPVDIVVTFDDNAARRCVQLGDTMYITGGQVMQYDGVQLVEVGFHVAPWYFATVDGGAGNQSAGRRVYQVTASWPNAQNEIDRSSSTTTGQLTLAASKQASMSIAQIHHTLKEDVVCEVWRTLRDPPTEPPFYLNTDIDPTVTSGDNRHLTFDPTTGFVSTYIDDLTDDDQRAKPAHPDNGGKLPTTAPPPATIIAASNDRLFLAGIAGYPHRVVYSKQRAIGEVASFHEGLFVDLPNAGGDITALAILDSTLIVFKERAVYAMPGIGYDNFGGGANFGPAEVLAVDVGADSADAVCVTPDGVIFHSAKGWHILDRGRNVRYIGHQVESFDGDEILGVHLVGDYHEVRAVSANRILVFNTKVQQWSEWTDPEWASLPIDGGAVIAGEHYLARDDEMAVYTASYAQEVAYSATVKTAPFKLSGQQGFGRVRAVLVLGEYKSAGALKVELFKDYEQTAFQTKVWTLPSLSSGDPLQLHHGPSKRKMQALSIRLTTLAADGESVPTNVEVLALTGIQLEVGVHRGPRRLPSNRRQ